VRENCQPLLRNSLRVILLLAFDGLQRVEIESHAPGDVNVRGPDESSRTTASERECCPIMISAPPTMVIQQSMKGITPPLLPRFCHHPTC